MDRNILRQYLSGLAGANNRFLLENSRYLGNLPQNIVYNGLLYTLNLRENAFINQFGHRIDASSAPAFITEARAFEQQNVVALDLSSASSDSSSSKPQPQDLPANVQTPTAQPNPSKPNTSVILTWDIPAGQEDNVDTFIVLRSTDPKGPFDAVKTAIPKGSRATFDDSVFADTIYYYQIESVYKGKTGAPSTIISVKTAAGGVTPTGITAPSGLTALNISQTGLNLRWVDNSTNEIGFFVEESVSGSTFTLIETVGAGVTFVGVKGLTQDTIYSFRVQAYGTGSTSGFSTVSTRTLPTLPAAPTGLSLLVGGTSQISLSWTDNSTNEQYFNIFRTVTGTAENYILGGTAPAGSTTFIATGLSAGTTYGFLVNAQNTGGTSGFAGPAFATTLPTVPTAPSNLRFTLRTSGRLDLLWNDNSTNESGFLVQSSTGGVTYSNLDTTAANINEYSARGLDAGSTYFFRVASFNSGGTSSFSGATSWQTLPLAPSVPTGFSAVVGSSANISLSWNDVANETGYELYRSLNGSSYTLLTTLGAGVTIFNNTGLNASTIYWYRLNAFNTGGTSDFTTAIDATTLPAIPATPSFTLISGTENSITVNWSNVANESGYGLYRSVDGGSSYPLLVTLAANTTSYTNTGLSSGTTYFYKLDAFNAGGTSALSGATSFVTPGATIIPAAPSALSAYSSVPATKNFLRYTEGFTTSVSQENGGWAGTSTTVSIDNSVLAPDGSTGAALLTVTSPATISGINSIITEPGITASDLWSGSVWLRGKTATSGSINVVVRPGTNQTTIPSTLKILSGPGTVVPSSVGEQHWNGIVGLSTTEWTRIAWNNITGWGTTGAGGTFTSVLLRLTVNYYDGTIPSAVTGDSIYVWGAQFERNPYPTAYLAATGGSFSERAFQGLTSQANLYWTDNSNNESGFLIERSTNDVTYAGITSVAANTTIYSDRGLSAGSTYFYRVSAFNAGGTSATTKSPSVVTYPVTSAPFAPSNFRFLSRAQNGFTLAWDDNSTNELGFIVQSSITDSGYATIATLGAGVTTYGATGLCAGSTYFFKVASYNSGGTSFSGTIAWETLPETPATPSFTSISGTTNSITLNWNNVSNETGYGLYRSTTLEGTYTGITTLGANVTTFVNSGLSSGTTFFYKIDAFNSGGTSALSGATSFTTVGVTPIPTAPSNLRFTGRGSGKLIFAWDDNSADETGFVIESSLNGSSYTTLTTVGVGVTNYDASGLSSGTTYFFQVAAFNSGGTSSFAGPTAWKTLPTTPANFTATTGSTNSINLAWTDVTGEDGYVLNRGLTSAFTSFTGITLAANATGYSDVGLCAGTTYWYRMYAFLNDGGTSGFAGPTFALTQEIAGGTPSSPTGFTSIDATTNSVTLQWTDTATNEDGFLIYYRGIT